MEIAQHLLELLELSLKQAEVLSQLGFAVVELIAGTLDQLAQVMQLVPRPRGAIGVDATSAASGPAKPGRPLP